MKTLFKFIWRWTCPRNLKRWVSTSWILGCVWWQIQPHKVICFSLSLSLPGHVDHQTYLNKNVLKQNCSWLFDAVDWYMRRIFWNILLSWTEREENFHRRPKFPTSSTEWNSRANSILEFQNPSKRISKPKRTRIIKFLFMLVSNESIANQISDVQSIFVSSTSIEFSFRQPIR